MSNDPHPFAQDYRLPPGTNVELEYADLPIIDISKIHDQQSRLELVHQVRQAFSQQGFLYIVNHGLSQAQVQRMFDIGNIPFDEVSNDEKQKYTATMLKTGSYQGYKLRRYWHLTNGVHDQLEHYNINRDVRKREHPEALRPFLPEIENFARHNHLHVLHPLLSLLSLGLGLPEDTLQRFHNYSAIGESYVRFMKYYPRSEEEENLSGNLWLKGHTDFGSITLLYSQPVAGLQILSRNGDWKWVKHIENALVVNAGDCLEFISGGLYRATIHRVVQPPQDQRGYARLGVFYFAIPDDDLKLVPLVDSPVLQELGIIRRCPDEEAPTVEAWRKQRTAAYGTSALIKNDQGDEEEVINGIVVKHYL